MIPYALAGASNTADQLRGPRFPAGADLVSCIPLFDSTAGRPSPCYRARPCATELHGRGSCPGVSRASVAGSPWPGGPSPLIRHRHSVAAPRSPVVRPPLCIAVSPCRQDVADMSVEHWGSAAKLHRLRRLRQLHPLVLRRAGPSLTLHACLSVPASSVAAFRHRPSVAASVAVSVAGIP